MKPRSVIPFILLFLLQPMAWGSDGLSAMGDQAVSADPSAVQSPHPESGGMAMDDTTTEADSPQQTMFLNMQRDGSGTGWQPVDNPMNMKMFMNNGWMTMLHGSAFLDDSHSGGLRGSDKIRSQNWLMLSTAHPVGQSGIFQLRGMFTAEPFTIGKSGYPLLFQTGEGLVDQQHPHDLFMELSAEYLQRIAPETWLKFYVAPVGEPALGPVTYHHRYSSFVNPEAPLGHHVQDSTHVAFGVLTAGVMHRKWQVEASLFNGKEPDNNRYNFDFGPLTSYSGRVSYMPSDHWAFQASDGFLDDPEREEPGDVNRATTSAQYSKTFTDGWWASTLVFGHNFESGPDDNSVLLESTVNFLNRNYLFGRLENTQKRGLMLADARADFNITSCSLGIARDLLRFHGIPLTLGAMVTLYAKPQSLDTLYGDFPVSFSIFLHTNAPRMAMPMGYNH